MKKLDTLVADHIERSLLQPERAPTAATSRSWPNAVILGFYSA